MFLAELNSLAGCWKGTLMDYYRRNWAFINLPFGVIAVLIALLAWNSFGGTRSILLILWAVFVFHQFEEYAWPGGEQWIMNRVLQPRDLSRADRFPLNQQSALVTNVYIMLSLYLVAVIFAGQIWLGIGVTLAGFAQIFVHGVFTNIKLKSFYNPGLLTAIVGFGGVGTWYIWYISADGLATGWDWVFGVIALPIIMAFGVGLPTYVWMADRNSPYPFSAAELRRFNAQERLARLGQAAA